LTASGCFAGAAGLAASSREFVLSCDGGGVDFLGGCASPFASLAVLALGLVFALLFALPAGGFALLGCSVAAGFEAMRAGGGALAGLPAGGPAFAGLPPGAPEGFAAIVGRVAGLTLVFGCAFGLLAGLYAAGVKGAECPTGMALGDGAILVTTEWLASDAGGRAEAAAGRAGPLTLSAVGATGFADMTLGLDTTSADTLTDAAATGCPP
jgi:hypothetical protein